MRYETAWFNVGLFAKIALGASDQEVDINGTTTLFSPTGNQTTPGGILALPSNIGDHNRTLLCFVPEGGISVGVNLTSHIELTAAYSFLYWNQVVRPNAQVDATVNTNAVPSDSSFGSNTGPGRPAFNFNEESFWMQTITFGLVVHY